MLGEPAAIDANELPTARETWGNGCQLRLTPGAALMLRELGDVAAIMLLTSLPPWASEYVMARTEYEGPWGIVCWHATGSCKAEAAMRHAGGRPFAMIDDKIGNESLALLAEEDELARLVIPDTSIGLTMLHVRRVAEILRA